MQHTSRHLRLRLRPAASTPRQPRRQAQPACETGWGRNMPADPSGRSSSNLFGVKAGNSWQGASTQAMTTEYVQGTPTTTQAAFRSYADESQSVGDYVSFLRGTA